jgi:hypothetical protein
MPAIRDFFPWFLIAATTTGSEELILDDITIPPGGAQVGRCAFQVLWAVSKEAEP